MAPCETLLRTGPSLTHCILGVGGLHWRRVPADLGRLATREATTRCCLCDKRGDALYRASADEMAGSV
ncbi:hypothetical protein SAMN05216174_113141 [Actinokineospora iranica]|uniref:Uncharacterized protein n=1 Tax=Actinokineospora iranica TaxID=1271860 RepID=A0A1G6VZ36_9PSEU|nr:hypothetical protein SAMN05216174_113141 [Actinokineospora iranica]